MDADPTHSVAATIPQMTASLPDPDWYLDHVVLPRGPEGGRLGPMRAWQGEWRARALELRRIAPDGPVAGAVIRRSSRASFCGGVKRSQQG